MKKFKIEFDKILTQIPDSPYSCQIDKIREMNSSVILYGAGVTAGMAAVVCKNAGINVIAVCDKNKSGSYIKCSFNLRIIKPLELTTVYKGIPIIVTSWKYENEIRTELVNLGVDSELIFPFWFPQRITQEIFERDYLCGFNKAYDFFEDDKSKELVIDLIASKLLSKPLTQNTSADMYYENEFVFSESEVFIDGGAYDGDTLKQFLRKVGGKYKSIYAFEPDSDSFTKLSECAREYDNTTLFNCGLGGINGEAPFYYSGLFASGFSEMKYFISEKSKIEDGQYKSINKKIVTIDSLNIEPTFIKLDVEGEEANCVDGAKETLINSKPKLAICVYHNVSNIYDVVSKILNIRNDYKFKIRQCDYGYYETVLYAY